MPSTDTFGVILRRELDRAAISVVELARLSSTTRTTIYNLLNDTHSPDFALVCRIAGALGVSTDTFRVK